MPSATSTLFLNVSAIQQLCSGADGTSILYGSASPTITTGMSGDFFLNISSISAYQLFGPKTSAWPVTGAIFTTQYYLTSYVNNIVGSLTGDSGYLNYNSVPGYGILSALQIVNGTPFNPSIGVTTNSSAVNFLTLCAFTVPVFTVSGDGSISSIGGCSFVKPITANRQFDTSGGTLSTSHNYIHGGLVHGLGCIVEMIGCHAEGAFATASGHYCHAEGITTYATSSASHAEGYQTESSGPWSHAEGHDTTASGEGSHSGGLSAGAIHGYTWVWNGSASGVGAGVASSQLGQFVAYGENNVHLGKKVGVNTFNITTEATPYTTLPATLTVNGTISASGTISSSSLSVSSISAAAYTINSNTFNNQVGISYTLSPSDNGKIITMNNATSSVLAVPTGLPTGFNCSLIQLSLSTVYVSAGPGVTINSVNSLINTSDQYGQASLLSYSGNTFILAGDLV